MTGTKSVDVPDPVFDARDPPAEAVLLALMGWPDPPKPAQKANGHYDYRENRAYELGRALAAVRRRPGSTNNQLKAAAGYWMNTELEWWRKRNRVRKVKKPGRQQVNWWPVLPPDMPLLWEGDDS